MVVLIMTAADISTYKSEEQRSNYPAVLAAGQRKGHCGKGGRIWGRRGGRERDEGGDVCGERRRGDAGGRWVVCFGGGEVDERGERGGGRRCDNEKHVVPQEHLPLLPPPPPPPPHRDQPGLNQCVNQQENVFFNNNKLNR